jgi:type IX secretion system PorP/SprF family membrane protein
MFNYLTQAQDVHLTQYYTSNLSLNPAFTGNYTGDVRAVLNYRSQWKQVVEPITTAMFSLEKKLTHFDHTFGLGFIAMNDRLTTYGLQNNKLYLSGSYAKKFNKNTLGIGVQGGFVMRSTNLEGQTFPGQWEYSTGTYNSSLPTNENALAENKSFLDFNVGGFYSRSFKGKLLTIGYALFNVNQPSYGFTGTNAKLPFRHVTNANVNIPITSSFSIKPSLLIMKTVQASNIILGANALQKINTDMALLFGLGIRGGTVNSDAAIAIAGINYKRIEFGLSFDFNMSELSKDTPRKSVWEISLVYTTPSRNIHKSTINCDRY